jgi:geranylgeranyl pyrophosphate synthase
MLATYSRRTHSFSDPMAETEELLEYLRALKERWLDQVMQCVSETVRDVSPEGTSLVPMADYHLGTGGKRLRALIPLAVAETLEVDPARVVPFAAACEILHNATLVHDDLQDGDEVRRGEPTVWKKWSPARAINLGDAMLFWTLALARRADFEVQRRDRLVERIVRDTIRVIDGQEREFLLKEMEAPSSADYFRMVEGKTSGLFALPMAGTAELCGAAPELVEVLADAAMHLGVLFQIQDDVLDLYADKGRDQRGSDIGEGKISALVVHFLEHAPADEAAWLREILDSPRDQVSSEDVDRAAQLFEERGTLRAALDEIERRRRLAVDDPVIAAHPELAQLLRGIAALFLRPIEHVDG